MREKGSVSLWLGQASTFDALEHYVQFEYSDDGDLLSPPFMLDFSLDRWDEDFREAGVLERPSSVIKDILRGCSYEGQIVPQFERLCGETIGFDANAVVLLYDYCYSGYIREATGPFRLRFMGIALYVHPQHLGSGTAGKT